MDTYWRGYQMINHLLIQMRHYHHYREYMYDEDDRDYLFLLMSRQDIEYVRCSYRIRRIPQSTRIQIVTGGFRSENFWIRLTLA